MTTSTPPVLVIGYGNTLRGDDGLGRLAAARLVTLLDPTRVRVMDCHQLTLDLAEAVSQARLLILIDAAAPADATAPADAAPEPGTIRHEDVVAANDAAFTLGHYLEPATLLAAAQALYGAAPRCLLWTVTASTFEHGEGLSPAVAAALPILVEQVRSWIETSPG